MKNLVAVVASIGVVVLAGTANAAYQLVDGIYTITVASGQTQTDLTDDDKAALADAACVELVKDGAGTLKLTKSTGISGFKGKITIAAGTYQIASDQSGFFGTEDGSTEVREGATLCFERYAAEALFSKEELTVGGKGVGNGGALRRENPTGTGSCVLGFKKLTLSSDTLVVTVDTSRGLEIRPKVLDMNGHLLRSEGMSGGLVCIDPRALVNPGDIYIKSNGKNYAYPDKATLDGGPSHVLTIDSPLYPSYGTVHTNFCSWTLRIVQSGCGIRAYKPPFVWDGPLQLPASGEFNVEVNNNGSQPDADLCYVRFNGPIYGGATIACNGDDETATIFGCATNAATFTGKFTWAASNRRHSIVSMVPGAVPNQFGAGVVGLSNNFQNGLGIGLRTASNPNGYDRDAVTNAWEECFLHRSENLTMYVEKGQTFRDNFTMDSTFNYYWRSSTNLRTGVLGGGEMVIVGLFDNCGLFRNFVGENLVFSAQARETGVNTIANFNLDGGRTILRDMGYFVVKSTTCGDLGPNERAELLVGPGSVMGPGMYGIGVGVRNTGAGGRLRIISGGIVTNKVSVASSSENVNCNGEILLDGGVLYCPADSHVGGSTNSCGAMTVNSGALTMAANLYVAGTAPTSAGVYRQFGGTAEFGDSSRPTVMCLAGGAGTSTVHVAGGDFTLHGKAFLPRPIQAKDRGVGGRSAFAVTAGSALVEGGCFLRGRSDSEGSVSVSGGGVLATKTIEKQTVHAYDESMPVTGGYASATFDGGTLKAVADGELFGQGEAALDAVNVCSGGIAVDTDGKDAAISVPLTRMPSAGAISALSIVNDKGVVTTLTNYKSCPAVLIFGDGHGASAVAEYDEENFTVTGIRILNPGWGYTAANTKAYVFQYGTRAKAELQVTIGANAASGGLVKKGTGTLTLGAANTYEGSTVVEGGTLRFAVAGARPAGSAVISRGGAVAASDYADVPKTIAFDMADPDPKAKIVLAQWDACSSGAPKSSDFTVTGLPDEWQLAVRGNSLVASKPRGMLILLK